ncbi:unnamed protein product, partial [Allacma fusca]
MGKEKEGQREKPVTTNSRVSPGETQLEGTNDPEISFKAKYFTTAAIYFCNVTFGMSCAYLAPLVVDFKTAYQTDVAAISVVFTVSKIVMLICSLAYGFIFNLVNRHGLIIVLLFISGILIILQPFSPTLITFGVAWVIIESALSGYGTAQIIWVIEIWKDAAGPYIQGQHFSFALGCIFPSLIFAPFLKQSYKSSSSNETIIESNQTLTSMTLDPGSVLSRLYVPCGIIGGMIILGSIFQLMLFLMVKVPKGEKPLEDQGVEATNSSLERDDQKGKKILLITLGSIFLGVIQAMEGIAFQFLPTFTHYSEVQMSEVEGANIMTAFTIAYTLGRLAGIFVSLKIIPQVLICVNILFVFASSVVLLIAGNGSDTHSTMLVGSILLGIGFSTLFPSIFDYLKIHLEITNVVGAILMVAGMSISSISPLIVGVFIEETPAVIVYLNFVCISVGVATFVGIMILVRGN